MSKDKFRKVRAGWYTLTIVGFEQVLAQHSKDIISERDRLYEEHIDVSSDGDGYWIVSTRGGRDSRLPVSQLNQNSLFRAGAMSFAEAKRYAVALRDYLADKGPNPDYLNNVFSDEREIALREMLERKHGKPYPEIAKAWGIPIRPLYRDLEAKA